MKAVINNNGDRYVSSSEMAGFCERVMAAIDRQLELVRVFDFDGGAEAGAKAAAAVHLAVVQITEFGNALELDREGAWGKRVSKQKAAIAGMTEGYLKKCSKLVAEALPLQPVRVGGATLRSEPRLSGPPDPRAVRRAMACLTFFDRVRASASQGGYGAVRGKVGEEVTHGLDTHIEDIIGMIRAGEAENLAAARAYLDVLADFMGLMQGEQSAQIVRRRAAAA